MANLVMKHRSSPIGRQVIFTLLAPGFIALLVLAFRYKNKEEIVHFGIRVKSTLFYTHQMVQFTAVRSVPAVKRGRKLLWDFGDHTRHEISDPVATHVYAAPGRYEVILFADGRPEAYQTVSIREAPPVVNPSRQPQFSGPASVRVGEEAVFKDSTLLAKKWEWRFGETNGVNAYTKTAKWVFKTPGTKRVILVVNDSLQGVFTVLVEDRPLPPVTPVPPPPDWRIALRDTPTVGTLNSQQQPQVVRDTVVVEKAPSISDKGIKSMLYNIIDALAEPADFVKYTCGHAAIPVQYNGMETDFKALPALLRDDFKNTRKIKSLEVVAKRNEAGCIIALEITASKKGLLGNIF